MSPPGSEGITVCSFSFIFWNSRENGLGEGHEGLVDVDLLLGGGLEELHSEAVSELLSFFV